MRPTLRSTLLAASLLVFTALGCKTAEVETGEIPYEKVPGKVQEAFRTKYPKAQVIEVERELQGGELTYEFYIKHDGKPMEVLFSPEGRFVGTEEVLAEPEVPPAVVESFSKKYPGMKPIKYEKETFGEGQGAEILYEVRFLRDGKKVRAKFAPGGRFVREE